MKLVGNWVHNGYALIGFLSHLWIGYQLGGNPFRRELPNDGDEILPSSDQYVTAYTNDAKGNVCKETSTWNGKASGGINFTYDETQHPHQLLKGLPLNGMTGFSPEAIGGENVIGGKRAKTAPTNKLVNPLRIS